MMPQPCEGNDTIKSLLVTEYKKINKKHSCIQQTLLIDIFGVS